MTMRILICCDGAWDEGRFPCRAFLPIELGKLRDGMKRGGWVRLGPGIHLCPACARKLAPEAVHPSG